MLARHYSKLVKSSLIHKSLRYLTAASSQQVVALEANDTTVHVDSTSVKIQWPKSSEMTQAAPHTSTYSHLWLRDNCQCPECLHPSNRQKLHSSADVPLDIVPKQTTLTNEGLEIIWNKSLRHHVDSKIHKSFYPASFLSQYSSPTLRQQFRFNNLKFVTWDRDLMNAENKFISYDEYNTEQGLYKALKQLFDYGIVFLKDVPTHDSKVTEVAEKIGNVRESFYGRDFDVKSVAKSKNIAYTSLYLGFHMDLL
jgi:gamma-butyrobetaine dioxygenase